MLSCPDLKRSGCQSPEEPRWRALGPQFCRKPLNCNLRCNPKTGRCKGLELCARLGSLVKITIFPTEEYFRTEEGFLVRLWHGTMDNGSAVMAYMAAIAISPAGAAVAREEAMVPIPGPEALITEVLWSKDDKSPKRARR